MHILLDARRYQMYLPLSSKMHGATELLLKYAARALQELGHRVDVIACEQREQYVDGVYWWTRTNFPRSCDVLVAFDQLTGAKDFEYKRLLLPLTFSRPATAGLEGKVDRVLCLSQRNKELLLRNCPGFKPEQAVIFPPCVDLAEYQGKGVKKILGRLIWCNSPDRGLWHLMAMWPALKEAVPNISLSITYDLEGRLHQAKWMHDGVAYRLWEVWEWAKSAPGVEIKGVLSRQELVQEQLKAQVFAYTCDPPERESMVHCISALECAAARCVLLMPSLEAFPDLFGKVAILTRVPIDHEEWIFHLKALLRPPEERSAFYTDWLNTTQCLAESYSYERYKERWKKLLEEICEPSPLM